MTSAPSGASSAPNTSVPFTLRSPSTRRTRRPTALPVGGAGSTVSATRAPITAAMILRYPVHRQRTPPSASITCGSVGFGVDRSSAAAATSIPGVQMPHWAPPWARKACCSPPISPAAWSPSSVSTLRPSRPPTDVMHALTGRSSSRTVHAPQSPASHPTLVAVRPRSSRSRSLRRVGEASASTCAPFTVRVTVTRPPHRSRARGSPTRPPPRVGSPRWPGRRRWD